jgi:hypothetical protein
MPSGYASPYDTSQYLPRLFAVCFISVLIEIVRYFLHPAGVSAALWAAICSPVLSCVYHAWSMPDSLMKASVSAALSEPSMPLLFQTGYELARSVAAALWKFLASNIGGLT